MRHGPVLAQIDAATWLAGLSMVELEDAVYWRRVSLPRLGTDPMWVEPHLASLRPAWEQAKAKSKANGDPADARMTLDLSGGPLLEWLYQNLFATFLEFASLYLGLKGTLLRPTVGWVVAYPDGGGDMKTLILDSVRGLTYGSVNPDSPYLDVLADSIAALVRLCAATNPEMEVKFMTTLVPYLVGSTPRCEWMNVDRALVYREARVTSGEARRLEFEPAANRPTDDALATLAALHGTLR